MLEDNGAPCMVSSGALAEPRDNPFDQALFITTIAPSILVAGTTGLTTLIPEIFKPAKSDALAFIGSEGIFAAHSSNRQCAITMKTLLRH
jgi:hypothetical protein